jgi:hypothetical protein
VELAGHLLAEDLGQGIGGLRAQLVLLVHRGVVGREVERQTEGGLAGRPDHPLQAQVGRGREHGVGADDVDPEHGVGGGVDRRGDGGQVDDRLDPGEDLGPGDGLKGLAEVGEVGAQERRRRVGRGRLGRRDLVDVQHLVAVLQQVPDDGSPGLPAPPGYGDPGHESLLSVPERTSFSAEHTMTELADLLILACSLDKLVFVGGASCAFELV